MKLFKRIQSLMLATIMMVMASGTTTAFAAENAPENAVWTATESSEVSDANTAARAGLVTLVNDTFNMSGTHRGASRTYNYNAIAFDCSIRDQNGNYLPNGSTILAIRLYDDTNGAMKEWQTSSNGLVVMSWPITRGHRYHFEYLVAYGTQNLRINMKIYGDTDW